jgi:hypothetical protein
MASGALAYVGGGGADLSQDEADDLPADRD